MTRSFQSHALALACIFALSSACGGRVVSKDHDGFDNGDTPGDHSGDWSLDGPGSDVEEEICGASDFDIARVIPDILILLDRSISMSTSPPDPTVWDTIRPALVTVTESPMDEGIWFGLMMFPGPDCEGGGSMCSEPDPGDVLVPVGPGSHPDIETELGSLDTCGATPVALSLQSAGEYLDGLTDGHPKYILLATDGAPNCNDSLDGSTCTCTVDSGCGSNDQFCLDNERTYDVLDDLCASGIETFVLGMGGAAEWAWVMSEMADHGCTGDYYPADDLESIGAALDAITGSIVTCQFELRCADIPDLGKVNFYYDPGHVIIPRDESRTSGWDWIDPCDTGDTTGTIEFFGEFCDGIMDRAYDAIRAEFGCPTVVM